MTPGHRTPSTIDAGRNHNRLGRLRMEHQDLGAKIPAYGLPQNTAEMSRQDNNLRVRFWDTPRLGMAHVSDWHVPCMLACTVRNSEMRHDWTLRLASDRGRRSARRSAQGGPGEGELAHSARGPSSDQGAKIEGKSARRAACGPGEGQSADSARGPYHAVLLASPSSRWRSRQPVMRGLVRRKLNLSVKPEVHRRIAELADRYGITWSYALAEIVSSFFGLSAVPEVARGRGRRRNRTIRV
jgi:hypothetical protein